MANGFEAGSDRIFDGEWRTAAMCDDACSVHSEEGHAAVFFGVGLFLDASECVAGEPCACHPDGALFQLAFEPREDCVGDGLDSFQHHVADESVADDHFDGIFEEVVTFDVASEVESAGFEKFERFSGELVALLIFRTDGHEPDGGVGVAEDVS